LKQLKKERTEREEKECEFSPRGPRPQVSIWVVMKKYSLITDGRRDDADLGLLGAGAGRIALLALFPSTAWVL
jgi:hypothetical protein